MTDKTDALQRFSFVDLPIRGQWVRMEHVLADAFRIKGYPGAIQTLLGQMLAAVAMFADNLKFTGAVALQSHGDGVLTRSLAECRSQRYLRAIAHLDQSNPFPDVADLRAWLGSGQLALSLIPDASAPGQSNQQQYQGFVQLEHATLASDLEHYFASSEQLDTRIYFASTERSTTGLLLQRLPDSDHASEFEMDSAADAWHTLTTLAETVTDAELSTLTTEQLLYRLFNEYPLRLHPARYLRYRCTCTRAKSDQTLQILGPTELQEILQEEGEVAVDCEFCGARYRYDAVDLATLQRNIDTLDPQGPRH
jgi:molecular chaperone Hsp33